MSDLMAHAFSSVLRILLLRVRAKGIADVSVSDWRSSNGCTVLLRQTIGIHHGKTAVFAAGFHLRMPGVQSAEHYCLSR